MSTWLGEMTDHPGSRCRRQHAQKLAVIGAVLRNPLIDTGGLERGEKSVHIFWPKGGDGVGDGVRLGWLQVDPDRLASWTRATLTTSMKKTFLLSGSPM